MKRGKLNRDDAVALRLAGLSGLFYLTNFDPGLNTLLHR